jgi:pseudouridine synthase
VESEGEGGGGKGRFDEAKLRETLKEGVETADGTYPAELLGVQEATGNEEEEEEDEEGGEKKDLLVLRVGVAEGKHRMVRRLLANAGYPVVGLHRVRYGKVELGDLAEGEVVEIDDASDVGQWARRVMEGKERGK